MSVRRLDLVQAESFEFTQDNLAWASKVMGNYPPGKQASAVIAIMWRAQEQNGGWVSRPAMEYVGKLLDMSFIRVYEIATFYTMFQLSPVGKIAHVQLCGTTPCMLRGAEILKKVCQSKIHHDPHHLSNDGNFSWEEVECLGACVNAPMVQIWKDTYEDLTPETFGKVLDDFASGKPVKPGPQNGRQLSAPEDGPTTLLDKDLYAGKRSFTRVEPPAPPPPVTPPPAPAAAAPPPAVVAPPSPIAPSPPQPAQSEAAAAPPSNAAHPKTSTPETAPAVASPSSVKTQEAAQDSAKIEQRAAASAQPTKVPERVAAARKAAAKETQSAPVVPSPQRVKPPELSSARAAAPAVPAKGPEWVAVRKSVSKDLPVQQPLPERAAKPSPESPALKAAPRPAGQPQLLKKPRAGKSDDLKLIWGVGPKLEALLNSMGVWHFDQIAAWNKAELAWVDERLEGFKGRASRDEWIKQSKKLAKGWRPDNAIGDRPGKGGKS